MAPLATSVGTCPDPQAPLATSVSSWHLPCLSEPLGYFCVIMAPALPLRAPWIFLCHLGICPASQGPLATSVGTCPNPQAPLTTSVSSWHLPCLSEPLGYFCVIMAPALPLRAPWIFLCHLGICPASQGPLATSVGTCPDSQGPLDTSSVSSWHLP